MPRRLIRRSVITHNPCLEYNKINFQIRLFLVIIFFDNKIGESSPKVSCVSGFCIISIFTDISILSVEVIQETQVDLLCNVTGVSVDPTEITWTVDGLTFSSNSVNDKYTVRVYLLLLTRIF